MIYTKAVDIGRMSDADIKKLQPGQWVYTDTNKPLWRGRFWGVKPSGTVVVAWQGNARKHKSYWSYQKALFDYARAR
jgi:hypothetical protein